MQERGLEGLEARAADGSGVVGRISEVVTDEETGEVTHAIVETGADGERLEVPITALTLDPEADFATFHADRSDAEPGDHVDDELGAVPGTPGASAPPDSEEDPQGYAPNRALGPDDWPHEGQFVAAPEDETLAQSPEELDREAGEAGGFEDEGTNPADSGYPRNDAYIDPDSGQERERYPAGGEDLRSDVEQLLDGTELRLRELREGVVDLQGTSGREDLEDLVAQISELDGVFDVDTTDVDVA